MKNLLWKLLAAGVVVVCGIWFLLGGGIKEHIEDTNGPDNYTLQTITDQNIRKLDTGSMGSGKSFSSLTNTTTYHSGKFSGVEVIHQSDIWATGLTVQVYDYHVEAGNFRLVLLLDDEIVHEFVPNGEPIQTCTLGKIDGLLSLRIAGESADYSFRCDLW